MNFFILAHSAVNSGDPEFSTICHGEIGLVSYWKEFGWPDLNHPVGEDDFDCE